MTYRVEITDNLEAAKKWFPLSRVRRVRVGRRYFVDLPDPDLASLWESYCEAVALHYQAWHDFMSCEDEFRLRFSHLFS